MNAKKHIGLQQLSALASTGQTLLGPHKPSKFIVDENIPGSVLICSPLRLLESLDLGSAVGQLLYESIQAQSKDCHTGMTTLLFLVHSWSNAVLECLQQGVPLSVVAAVMSEGLNFCIEQIHCLSLSLHDIQKKLKEDPVEYDKIFVNNGPPPSERQIADVKKPVNSNSGVWNLRENAQLSEEKSGGEIIQQEKHVNLGLPPVNSLTCSPSESIDSSCVFSVCKTMIQKKSDLHNYHWNALTCNRRPTLIHSRYFSGVNNYSSPPTLQVEGCPKHLDRLSGLGQLALSLSHGYVSAMKLVQDVLKCQLQTANPTADTCHFQLSVSDIVTCSLPGISESHSCVQPGFITLVCPAKAAVVKQFQDMPVHVILADGELTETFRHLGFNRLQNVSMFSESVSHSADSSSLWADSMLDILIQSNANLVLVQGDTCKRLEERCLMHKIVIINHVAHNVLRAFSDITGAERVTYLSQVNEHSVGKGICMNIYGDLEMNLVEVDGQIPVALTAEGLHLVTVVLSCPVTSKMQAVEDQFWTCVHRLHHALLQQAVFPGGGAVELLCLILLENLEKATQHSTGQIHVASSWLAKSVEQYKPLVINALACGWHQYLLSVMRNAANCTSEFEASTLIQQHLRKASLCVSPSAYILEEFEKGGLGMSMATSEHAGMCGRILHVYDNITPKIEAWHRALELVLLVLQTDAEIIVGPKRDELLKSQHSREFLFL